MHPPVTNILAGQFPLSEQKPTRR